MTKRSESNLYKTSSYIMTKEKINFILDAQKDNQSKQKKISEQIWGLRQKFN